MEEERLKFCIQRFDNYYNNVNSKGALFLGLNTFIVGGGLKLYISMLEKQHVNPSLEDHLLHWNIISIIVVGIAIMITVIWATAPFMSKNRKNSLYYFGTISCHEDFQSKSETYSEDDVLKDLRNQVFELSYGLKNKFNRLKWAGRLFIIQFSLFIPLVILLTIILKQSV